MKISIITITYNSAKTLPRALASVTSQKYDKIEHIIVDGASTDGTIDLIKAYAGKEGAEDVRWVSEPDNGIYDALNKGIKMATGDIIGFLHSDDWFFSSDSIGEIASVFASSDADIVYGDLQYCKGDKVVRRWISNPFRPSDLKYGWMPPHPTLYCRREVYEQTGLYDERLRISADYDMILRLFRGGYKSRYIPSVLVCMEIGGASNKDHRSRWAKTYEDYLVLKKNHVGAGFFTVLCKQFRKLKQFIRR